MNYKRFFTLPYIELNDAWLESYASDCLAVLLGLGMFTKVLGKTYAFKDYKKLMKDDKAMLVGALLLKFSVILHSSCLTANLIGPNDKEDLKKTKVEERDSTTTLIATLHASIGCIPNVEYCHAHGNKFITYAIQPIKAGDKLIANMKSKSIWDREKKSVRQKLYEAFYGSSCTCLACTEDWSDFDRGNYIDLHISDSTKPKIVKLWTEMDSILLGWKDISNETNFPDIKILNQTTDFVTKVCNEVSMPSAIVIRSVILLMLVLQAFHDPSEIHTEEKRISRKQEFKQVFDTSEMMKEMVKICNK
ncbi:hypothetical protein QAD02_011354 [Eretmocerus hayati]|uniref:Uncharacterized protein n=1 Tax=Eretmocerus hayati TaxID=131215 RepID=A0ACC2NXI2_9HYME|nr:hypothetical protein QAD02_011354 [Eretmocerus hayati]